MSPREKFSKKYNFLGIFTPKETLNDSSFHFYTEPQPGFEKVMLHSKASKKQMLMYYETLPCSHTLPHPSPDTSPLITPEYFGGDQHNQEVQVVDKGNLVRESQWVRKYEPKNFSELLTDDKVNRNMAQWVNSWQQIVFRRNVASKKNTSTPAMFNRNLSAHSGENNSYLESIFSNPRKLLLLAGPPGCGKTTLMRVLAKHYKYQIIEINASDDRTANNLIEKLEGLAGNDTIRGDKKPVLICLDEIDGVGESEGNGIGKILDYLENGKKNKKKEKEDKNIANPIPEQSQRTQTFQKLSTTPEMKLNRPVVFICNDPYAKSLKELRSKAHIIYMNELSTDRVVKRMREICEKEKVVIELQVLNKIAEICKNDIRSCIGVLELISKEKRMYNKNPKELLSKLKLSFSKDSQSSVNEFLEKLFFLRLKERKERTNLISEIESEIYQIENTSLLLETFMANLLLGGAMRKGKQFLKLYDDIVLSDTMGGSFGYNGESNRFQAIPYIRYALYFGGEDYKKIEFPSAFFERYRKTKQNQELLKTIYTNIPLCYRMYLRKESLVGPYLHALYLSMQTQYTKEEEITRCVSLMLTYGFSLKKMSGSIYPIFNPEIETLLTYGSRKPEILISAVTRTLMEENYNFFKERRDMLLDIELRDNTMAMLNQMHIHSRKKQASAALEGIKYRFLEGTGTKTTKDVRLEFFFQ